jgi:hypothetical protein
MTDSLLLIYADEATLPAMSQAEQEEFFAGYREFNRATQEAGVFRGANRLERSADAATQRVRNGRAMTTDGPFAETREALAGYYLISCESIDEALEWAARVPGARIGSVEVRPVMADPMA